MKYIQKPVEVDARQLKEGIGPELQAWVNETPGYSAEYWFGRLTIVEPNDRVEWTAYPNEWIVKVEDEVRVYGVSEFPQLFEKGE